MTAVRVLSVVLLLQAAAFYGFSRPEHVPQHRALSAFATTPAPWLQIQEQQLDAETLQVLRADDTLARVYRDGSNGRVATLFVAYFNTQRTGKTPHSPKNCLPGSGWVALASGYLTIPIEGAAPITVNRYVVAHGDAQDVVLYWYQAHNRVVASELSAKVFTVTDAIRYRRSDTALVRVVTDVRGGDIEGATRAAEGFVQGVFLPLKTHLGD